jgi:hypothetical protein
MDKRLTPVFHTDTGPLDHAMSEAEKAHRDEALDEALRCTFPASDPIAVSFSFPFFGVGKRKRLLGKRDSVTRKSL